MHGVSSTFHLWCPEVSTSKKILVSQRLADDRSRERTSLMQENFCQLECMSPTSTPLSASLPKLASSRKIPPRVFGKKKIPQEKCWNVFLGTQEIIKRKFLTWAKQNPWNQRFPWTKVVKMVRELRKISKPRFVLQRWNKGSSSNKKLSKKNHSSERAPCRKAFGSIDVTKEWRAEMVYYLMRPRKLRSCEQKFKNFDMKHYRAGSRINQLHFFHVDIKRLPRVN